MSFFETGHRRFVWTAPPVQRSVPIEHGCVQCGNRLEADGFGRIDGAGKCFNCLSWVSDEDEIVDDLDG